MPIRQLDVPLSRDIFMRTLIRELSGTLQDVVGLDEAAGFVSVVGQTMGREMDKDYRAALRVDHLSREQVADAVVEQGMACLDAQTVAVYAVTGDPASLQLVRSVHWVCASRARGRSAQTIASSCSRWRSSVRRPSSGRDSTWRHTPRTPRRVSFSPW